MRTATINGFTFEIRPTSSCGEYVVTGNGVERVTRIAPGFGGYYVIANDARYVVMASDVAQGKHGQEDLVICSFDMQAKEFVKFQVPESSLFHSVGGPANPEWLWAKNGGSQPSTFPADLGGLCGRYDFLSVNTIQLVNIELFNDGNNKAYYLYNRSFDPATGMMQPFDLVEGPWPVDPANPTEPPWF